MGRNGENKNAFGTWVGKPEGKKPLERPGVGEKMLKCILKK